MSRLTHDDEKHLQELLAGKVLGDLSNDELQEFAELFSTINVKDLQELEFAAAALQLALADPAPIVADDGSDLVDTKLPDFLRQKIMVDAGRYVVPATNQTASTDHRELPRSNGKDLVDMKRAQPPGRLAAREIFAWLAVAASLTIAAQLWFSSTSKVSVSESRLALLNNSRELIRADWTDGKTPFKNPVKGDVVWNNESQQGFMRFVGMPKNDPTQEQYQLWIIDPGRDDEPIDGGVFDIADTGEVIVPIQAKLKVVKPTVFAITIEKPGGVVVSTQERLQLLAQVAN
jgi:Anti-sigma-K factor rskA